MTLIVHRKNKQTNTDKITVTTHAVVSKSQKIIQIMFWTHHHKLKCGKIHSLIWFDSRWSCDFSTFIIILIPSTWTHNYKRYMKKVEKSLNRINAFIEIHFYLHSLFFLLPILYVFFFYILNINIVWAHLIRYFKRNRINLIGLYVYNFAFNVIAASFFS